MKGNIKINPLEGLEGKMKFLTLIAIIWTCLLIIFTNLNTATSSPQYKISSLSLDEWNYRKPIWIQADQVDENLTNFPVLIQINDDNDLASHAQNDFDDICFVNENCTIKLNHEIEAFDSINGNLTAWVNIPFLSNTSNTTIYMYYGNPTCDTQENSTGVWDSHYKGVWHMAEVNADDSTCYNNDGTESGGVSLNLSGKIGRATEFDGIDDNINVGNDNSIKPGLPITISCWINAKNIDGSVYQFIFNNDKWYGNYRNYFGAHIGIIDKISIGYGDGGPSGPQSRRGKTATTILSENCWYYVVGIIRGATDMDLYLNGVNDGGTYDGSGGSIHYSSSSGYIAQGGYNNDFFHGVIDEVRISDIARNECWIKTSYNNQNNPSAFIEIGVEEYMGNLSVVYVDDDFNISTPGWQYNHFDKIQDGIDAVNENGTVYVFNGTYYENVVINKTIHLIGEDRNGTIIDGGGNGNVIKITENWVIVKNFRLQNSGNDSNSAGLKIENSINSVISNISCSDNNNYGIHIYNSEPFLRSIHVYNNSKTGVYVYFNQNCENAHTPKINNLTVKNNGEYGIEVYAHVGYIWPGIDREYHAIITNSTISENTNYGMYLHCYATGHWSGPWVVEGKLYTTIKNCIISDCRGGITTYHDHGPYGISYLYMALQNTTIINNTERGVILRNIGVQEDSTSVKNNGIVDWCGNGYTFGNWTWHNESIYNFNGTIEINSGHVLTIEAGTTVIFEGNDTELFVKGAINATGDENHRIYFTSNKKEWKGIFLDDICVDTECIFAYCNIDFAKTGIECYKSSPLLSHLYVHNCSIYGVKLGNFYTKFFDSYIKNINGTGVYLELDQTCNDYSPKLINLTVENVTNYGVEIYLNAGYTWPGIDCFVYPKIVNLTVFNSSNYGVFLHSYSTGQSPWLVEAYLYVNIKNSCIDECFGGVLTSHSQGWYGESAVHIAIQNSYIANNSENGVNLLQPTTFNISYCEIRNNTCGINISGTNSDSNIIWRCNIKNNLYGIYLNSSYSGVFYHNNLVNNVFSSYDNGNNTWDNGYPSGGNYWSDFDEPSEGAYDNNSDGIVDSPYNISGGSNVDRYPLMNPIPHDTIPPETTLTQAPSGAINYNDVTFEWTGSDDITPTPQLLYSYKLEGYDSSWSNWVSSTNKTYNDLPDGNYTFEVKAKDESGNVDPTPASQSFVIDTTPPSIFIKGIYEKELVCNNFTLNVTITDESGIQDAWCNIDGKRYNLSRNGNYYYTEFNDSILTHGKHCLNIMALDVLGHTKNKTINFTMANLEIIPLLPTDKDIITMNVRLSESNFNFTILQIFINNSWKNYTLEHIDNKYTIKIGPYAPFQNITYKIKTQMNNTYYVSRNKTFYVDTSDIFGPEITTYTMDTNITKYENVTIRALIADESGVKPVPIISYSTDNGKTYIVQPMCHRLYGYYETTIGPFPDNTSSIIYYTIYAEDIYGNPTWYNSSFFIDTGRSHFISNFAEPTIDGFIEVLDGWQPAEIMGKIYQIDGENATFCNQKNLTIAITRNQTRLNGLIMFNVTDYNIEKVYIFFDCKNNFILEQQIDIAILFSVNNWTINATILIYNGTSWVKDNITFSDFAYTLNDYLIIEFSKPINDEFDGDNVTKIIFYAEGNKNNETATFLWPTPNEGNATSITLSYLKNLTGDNANIFAPVNWAEFQANNLLWIVEHNLPSRPLISAGESLVFNFTFHTLNWKNVTSICNLTLLNLTFHGPNGEKKFGFFTQNNNSNFICILNTNYTEQQGEWFAHVIVEDEYGNKGEGMITFLILDVYQVQLYQNHISYIPGENAIFYALISKYGKPLYYNESQINITATIINQNNQTVVQTYMQSCIFHNQSAFVCIINTSNFSYDKYVTSFMIKDVYGNMIIKNLTFDVISDFYINVTTDKNMYVRGESVNISGWVISQEIPLSNAIVNIKIKLRGIIYNAYVRTNDTGYYCYSFDTSNIYLGYCNITAVAQWNNQIRENSTDIIIHGLYVSPSKTPIELWLYSNSTYTASYLVYNIGETNLTNFSVTLHNTSIYGITCTINTSELPSILIPGDMIKVNVTITTENATNDGQFTIIFGNDQHANETRIIEVNILMSYPHLTIEPNSIELSMTPGAYATQNVVITNTGTSIVKDIRITSSLDWVHITSTALGNVSSGEFVMFDVNIQSRSDLMEGIYNGTIQIDTENCGTYILPIKITIVNSSIGGLLYNISDDIGEKVAGARITITNQNNSTLYWSNITNNNGFSLFAQLPPGRYSYTISSDGHETLMGTVKVEPGIIKQLDIIQYITFIEYQWVVRPVKIEDQYYITLEMEYHPDFPAPVIVPMPGYIQYDVIRSKIFEFGYDDIVYAKICNYGTAPVYNITITSYEENGYNITPLLLKPVIPIIEPHSYISIPFKFSIDAGTIVKEGINMVAKIGLDGEFLYYPGKNQTMTAFAHADIPIYVHEVGNRTLIFNPPILWKFLGITQDTLLDPMVDELPPISLETRFYVDTIKIINGAEENEYALIQPISGGFYFKMSIDMFMILPTFVGFGVFMGTIHEPTDIVIPSFTWTDDQIINIFDENYSMSSLLCMFFTYETMVGNWLKLYQNESADADIFALDFNLFPPVPSIRTLRIPSLNLDFGFMLFKYRWQYDTFSRLKLYLINMMSIDTTFNIPLLGYPANIPPGNIDDDTFTGDMKEYISEHVGEILGIEEIEWPEVNLIDNPQWPYRPPGITRSPINTEQVIVPEEPLTKVVNTPRERIRLRINQKLTLERDAFQAELQMTNKLLTQQITNISINIEIKDKNGSIVTNKFFINTTYLKNINTIDGTGVLTPLSTALIEWIIIPEPGCGGKNINGIYYYVYAIIETKVGNITYHVETDTEEILVKPQPLLDIEYYIPQHVYGDDPLTPEIEPSVPFKIAVKITNVGYGIVHNVTIDSSQVMILKNVDWTNIDFEIIGCYVNNCSYYNVFTINFGDIYPGEKAIGYWILKCSCSGNFTTFTAQYTHSDALGGKRTSLIRNISTHIIFNDDAQQNGIDCLLFFRDGNISDVYGLYLNNGTEFLLPQLKTHIIPPLPTNKHPYLNFSLVNNTTYGWGLIVINDTLYNTVPIKQVEKLPNITLDSKNYWLSQCRIYIADYLYGGINKSYSIEFYNVSILTKDIPVAYVDRIYQNDYNSTKDNFNVHWNLSTNADFLSIDKWRGILKGVPNITDVGIWWVNVTVYYGVFYGYHNFSLNVTPLFVYVDDGFNASTPGWNITHFNRIQDGISAVAENGTVYVFDGIYYENIVINKTINLLGEDKETTIIDGNNSGDVMYINANNVTIEGFTMRHSGGDWYAGIKIYYSSNAKIYNCNISNNYCGICAYYSYSNTIYNNYFNNINNSYDNGNNTWNITKTLGVNIIDGPYLGGNFWSDYTGVDLNGDGLGDTNIPYGPGDWLPLVKPNYAPTAYFSYLPSKPTNLDRINFMDLSNDSDGIIVNWTWNFGDGNYSYEQNPTHQYTDVGTYNITLTVRDNDGAPASVTKQIIVVSIDYILVTYENRNEIQDYNISINFSFIAYTSAFNNTFGFIKFVNANWSILNNASNAGINSTNGKSILFNSGNNDGTAILTAEYNGHNNSVVFTINSSLFSFFLYRGWNLITLPCENNYNASSLYSTVGGCSIILSWNGSLQDFILYVPGSPYDFEIENGHSYFIGMRNDSIFSLVDASISFVSVPLYIGWNCLGWFKENETTASSLYNAIDNCTVVLKWDASIQDFDLYAPGIPDDFVISRGDGFLVAVSKQSIWHGEG